MLPNYAVQFPDIVHNGWTSENGLDSGHYRRKNQNSKFSSTVSTTLTTIQVTMGK